MSMNSGGTLEGQHQRTVELIEQLIEAGDLTLYGLLYLLHDTQATTSDLKRLAEIAQSRRKPLTLSASRGEAP